MPKISIETNLLQNGIFSSNASKLIWFCLLRDMDDDGLIHTSALSLSKELGLSEPTVRRILLNFESEGVLTNKVTNKCRKKGRIYLLCNTDICNRRKRIKRLINDECFDEKKTANANQITSIRFTPPTDAEVAAYVAEKGYHFNPAQFVPFYQSKGWRIGKEPMKDWKAACRSWELKWKEKYGTADYRQIKQNASSEDRFAARRGTDVGGLKEADYGGSF